MSDFDIPKVLVDAGGWVFASAVLTAVLILIRRGDLVPGFVYKREVERADKATEQVERQTEAIKTLTAEFDGFSTLAQRFIDSRERVGGA